MYNIQAALDWARQALSLSQTPQLDAQVLLGHVLAVDRSYLYAWPDKTLTEEQTNHFERLVGERKKGKPIAYLVGHQEFWSMTFQVNEHTLIPRADTEILVESLLDKIPNHHVQILELGTGTSAIACALAKERDTWDITATDVSLPALEIAKQNAMHLGFLNIQFIHSDWFQNIPAKRYDAIISNPPYVEENSPYLQDSIQFEPKTALTSGSDGLEAIKHIIKAAPDYLKQNAWLLLEHGDSQAEAVSALLLQRGYSHISQKRDLAGMIRVSMAKAP